MKKLVYLALALCVMVAAFSGCGGKSDDGGNSSAVSSPPATVTPTPTPESQTAKALRVTADSGLNIRAEASTDGEILGLAENGQRLALMLEDPQNGWYQVQYNGQTAFVSADYAEVVEVTLEEYNQLRGTSSGTDTTSDTSAAATPTPAPDDTSSSGTDSYSSTSSTSSSTNPVDAEDGE